MTQFHVQSRSVHSTLFFSAYNSPFGPLAFSGNSAKNNGVMAPSSTGLPRGLKLDMLVDTNPGQHAFTMMSFRESLSNSLCCTRVNAVTPTYLVKKE